jgi:hypothetical protein
VDALMLILLENRQSFWKAAIETPVIGRKPVTKKCKIAAQVSM